MDSSDPAAAPPDLPLPKPGRGSFPHSGRKKGTPNKLTVNVRRAIEGAFDRVGGEDYLVRIAEEDPRTFCSLLAKVLPQHLTGSVEVGLVKQPQDVNMLEVARRIVYILHKAQQQLERKTLSAPPVVIEHQGDE